MELRIWAKQTQQFNSIGQPIVFVGNNPQTIVGVVNGTLAANRQFTSYPNYIDITEYVSDPYKLSLTWTAERDNFGEVVPGETQIKKGASGVLSVEGEAYTMFKKWLVDDVSAPLNAVDIKIEHVGCGTYDDYQIKATDITYCESNPAPCTFDVTLKQKDEAINCIKRTVINDNSLHGWFKTRPDGGKKHPRFSYCNEQRPNGVLVAVWYLLTTVISVLIPILTPILLVVNLVILVVLGIVTVINGIISAINTIPGININPIPTQKLTQLLITPKEIIDGIANIYVETAGCGREHPAPLIRDYIKNVCDICGIQVDATTAPLFFAPSITIETNSRGIVTANNQHYNACYFLADVERGIKRRKTLSLSGNVNNTDYYVDGNDPNKPLDLFLDELKALYNQEWRVTGNKLYIQRKDFFTANNAIYDFTATSPDRLKLLEGICFEWNEIKYPAYTEGLYQLDPMDKPGNEAQRFMNDFISHGNVNDNPNFEGKREIKTEFGATRFRLDGVQEDYVYDAFQITLLLSMVNIITVFFNVVVGGIKDAFATYADYALLLDGETAGLPKVIIWDGQSFNNAKAVRYYSAAPIANYGMPPINTNYNTLSWNNKHLAKTEVRGAAVTLPPFYPGYYSVTGFFGGFEIKQPALLCNYPMYFQSGFQDNLYDWFHWIDDPMKNPKAHKTFTAKIELCCPDLQLLGVFNDASGIALGSKVKVNDKYYQDGKITEISVNYDPSADIGQHIEIKGTL